jgi:UDP-3-O-[3-hydroxymyristoyl] N-acetylglucosamine deacetylase
MGRGIDGWQTTLGGRVTLEGVGVHTGAKSRLTLLPTAANTGVCFVRSDIDAGGEEVIPARHRNTAATELATVIGNPAVAAVSTVEHVMSALAGMGVDNAVVEIDGPEVPIMDGSALPFVEAIRGVGVTATSAPRRFLKVLKTIRVEHGAQFGEISPHDGFHLDIAIDFPVPVIGRQRVVLEMTPDVFAREVAFARTFGFAKDVERLWAAGFALGASLENTVVVAEDGVMNPDGLRRADEFVRHKALDAVGDLALAGLPILGAFKSSRGGHKLNAQVLGALLSDPRAYTVVEAETGRRVPPPVRAGLRAPPPRAFAAAAFGPER